VWKKIGAVLLVFVLLTAFGLWRLSAMFEPTPEPVAVGDPGSLRSVAQGKVIGFADAENTYSWRGIPYAQPPVGALRWHAPQPAPAWSGTREALRFGAMCPQIGSVANRSPRSDYGRALGTEDCLTLNVWTPRFAPDALPQAEKRLPVMVWIHGGANINGTSSMYAFVRNLAGQQNVVVVSINYRLGIFGWFHHPALDTDTSTIEDRSGNYGTLDIIQALRWVQSDIAAFGGDPHRVTIFGESAGGFNVYSMLLSPLAHGLFQGAISQSGSTRTVPLSTTENYRDDALPGHERSAREIVNELLIRDGNANCRDDAKALQERMDVAQIRNYLHSKSPAALLATVAEPENRMATTPAIFRDGAVIPKEDPLELLADPARYNSVPFMAGTNHDEARPFNFVKPEYTERRFGFIPHIRDRPLFDRASRYGSDNWIAGATDEPLTAMSSSGRDNVFGYRFDWHELPNFYVVDLGDLFGAGHSVEVNFVFNVLDNHGMLGSFYDRRSLPGRIPLAHAMSSYWAEFAYTGKPGRGRAEDLPEWRAWDNGGDKYVIFDSSSGGGIRMASQSLSREWLKDRLPRDREWGAIPTDRELCRWFAEFFLYAHVRSDRDTRQDYDNFGPKGCAAYPPAQFRVWTSI
jgi:para-nitrobenzyl esterase